MVSTGCPNKHGNSVTNSILSFKIILRFSILIPTEKAVIRKIFVCYVYNLYVYVLTAYCCTYILYTNRVNLSSLFILLIHYRPIFTAIYCFHKINLLWLLKLGITMLNHNKDEIEFVTEFPCLLGHLICAIIAKNFICRQITYLYTNSKFILLHAMV